MTEELYICPMHKQCDKNDCSHRNPHYIMGGCNVGCMYNRGVGKCVPYVHREFNLEVKIL